MDQMFVRHSVACEEVEVSERVVVGDLIEDIFRHGHVHRTPALADRHLFSRFDTFTAFPLNDQHNDTKELSVSAPSKYRPTSHVTHLIKMPITKKDRIKKEHKKVQWRTLPSSFLEIFAET